MDANAGGGGLLTVPALLASGLPPHLALATNKGQSVFGAAAALARFSHAGMVPFATQGAVVWHTALCMAAGQLVGGWVGAHLTVRGGDRIVRWVVLCVVAALVLKLSLDALRGLVVACPGVPGAATLRSREEA